MRDRVTTGSRRIVAGSLVLFALCTISPALRAQPGSGDLFAVEGWLMTFRLVPVRYWDTPEGPHGHELPEGTVRLYRHGSYDAELVGRAGEPIPIPPGDWVWVAEAPGFVSTFTNSLRVPEGGPVRERDFTVPVTPACQLVLAEDRRWQALDRLDVASLDEAAVYPVLPNERRELWVPQGNHLAYGVESGEIRGIGPIGHCRRDERIGLPYPEPPTPDRQSLVISARLPDFRDRDGHDELVVELLDPRLRATTPPLAPDATLAQGQRATAFFLDVAAEHPVELSIRHPSLRSATEPVEPEGGSVREVDVGTLLDRRTLAVSVDYAPARDHGSAEIELRYCGRRRTDEPPVLLLASCAEPLQRRPLEPGVRTYELPSLDDGQYLVSARVDGEMVPGLGQRVMPYLAPGSEESPVEVARLTEMHVHGHLLRGDDPVRGTVRLEAWSDDSGIPTRTFPTDDSLEYHLYYFARYPTSGEAVHFPEELRDTPPEELPGLYCCFQVSACGEGGACRTFNIHSAFTGEGRFDIELPGDEVVEVRARDAATGEPVAGAHMMVAPSPAFHFVHGEVLWHEAIGAEPDSLGLGGNGRVRWLPPEPGRHRIYVRAPGYDTASTEVDVPPAGSVTTTLEMERRRFVQGTRLLFADGRPVANAQLLAFDDEGKPDTRCHAATDGEGYAEPDERCTGHTFLLIHPWAAMQIVSGNDLSAAATAEVEGRPPFPPSVRLVDPEGEPVRDAFVMLRLDGLVVTPNDLFAAATAGVPFQASNAAGEIVLNGLDPDRFVSAEVSPWVPYEESWVALDRGRNARVELTAAFAE